MFGKNFSHGSIKQSTRTYHTQYSLLVYEMLLPIHGSLKASLLFFNLSTRVNSAVESFQAFDP